tara:strand:+ start:3437 stop:3646 length:210 start_codon:yes stop_codon:yes gene_type:complete
MISGELNSMELDVTQDQLNRWQGGELIQDVFPHLNVDEREFIKTGITPQEWSDTFGEWTMPYSPFGEGA